MVWCLNNVMDMICLYNILIILLSHAQVSNDDSLTDSTSMLFVCVIYGTIHHIGILFVSLIGGFHVIYCHQNEKMHTKGHQKSPFFINSLHADIKIIAFIHKYCNSPR